MIDLASLVGFANSKLPIAEDGYYLQAMGIDIWRLRDIKPRQILVVLGDFKNAGVSAKSQSLLLENILLSTNIPRTNFDVVYDWSELEKDLPSFNKYAAVISMGQNIPVKMPCTNILTLPHLSQLLADVEAKKQVYLAMRTLG